MGVRSVSGWRVPPSTDLDAEDFLRQGLTKDRRINPIQPAIRPVRGRTGRRVSNMPGAGIEPASPLRTTDFKSVAFADFAIPARTALSQEQDFKSPACTDFATRAHFM